MLGSNRREIALPADLNEDLERGLPARDVNKREDFSVQNGWTGGCVSDCDVHLLHVLMAIGGTGDVDAARPVVALLCDPTDVYECEKASFVVPVVQAVLWQSRAVATRRSSSAA
jgi:hypothetical protein